MAQRTGNYSDGCYPLKLVVDDKRNRVLFAEAGKELVDFFFSLMLLPLGAVVSLVGKESVPGSVAGLHESISTLEDSYIAAASPRRVKDELISIPPLRSNWLRLGGALLLPWKSCEPMVNVYKCSTCYDYISEVYEGKCPSCTGKMTVKATLVQPSAVKGGSSQSTEDGFVKGPVAYAITDDLSIGPISTTSILALMKTFKANDFGGLHERTVMVGVEQGIKILEASLRSKTVLSDVFLSKKKPGP